jgi:hypothetical protein
MNILGFILGGKFQLGIIAIVIAFVGYLAWDYKNAKVQLAVAKRDVAEAKAQYNQLRTDFNTYKESQVTLNTMFAAQRGLVIQQEKTKESIRNVPVKGTDRPFVDDPGLLERARRLREYQQKSTVH